MTFVDVNVLSPKQHLRVFLKKCTAVQVLEVIFKPQEHSYNILHNIES